MAVVALLAADQGEHRNRGAVAGPAGELVAEGDLGGSCGDEVEVRGADARGGYLDDGPFVRSGELDLGGGDRSTEAADRFQLDRRRSVMPYVYASAPEQCATNWATNSCSKGWSL